MWLIYFYYYDVYTQRLESTRRCLFSETGGNVAMAIEGQEIVKYCNMSPPHINWQSHFTWYTLLQLRMQQLTRDHFSMLAFWRRQLHIICYKFLSYTSSFGWQEMSCLYITGKWLKLQTKNRPTFFKQMFHSTGLCISNWQISFSCGHSGMNLIPHILMTLFIFSLKRIWILRWSLMSLTVSTTATNIIQIHFAKQHCIVYCNRNSSSTRGSRSSGIFV